MLMSGYSSYTTASCFQSKTWSNFATRSRSCWSRSQTYSQSPHQSLSVAISMANSTICSSFFRRVEWSPQPTTYSWVTTSIEATIQWRLFNCWCVWRLGIQATSPCSEATMKPDKSAASMAFMMSACGSMVTRTLGSTKWKYSIIWASGQSWKVRSSVYMAVWARTSRPSTKFDCLSAESKFLMRGPSLTSCGLILRTWRHGL